MWLWLIGILMNALIILFFFSMYQAWPAVMFSAGGLATKIAQVAREVTLSVFLVKTWLGAGRLVGK
jgi:hypothetical protein